ncbi:MAG: restriction endonuclease subunit S [Aphanocapsa sp. GSE-SYN-MK-11-07L]|jgi:type I restriction enzyme S subunit|nr:restriction endonuclease subunit S [Aphanocapsa sp. GSE-SYN-MK-11-07L]
MNNPINDGLSTDDSIVNQLPKGWNKAALEQLCDFNPRHSSLIDRQTAVSFVPMPAVCDQEGIILSYETRLLEEVWKGYTHFQDNDVIFAKITPCMENGKIALASELHNGLACGSTEFHVLRSLGAVLPEYLWRFVRQVDFRKEAERYMTGAVGQRRVPAQFLKEINLPVPPISEQHRIVAKLDRLFAHSRRAREELERVSGLCDRYRQTILTAACSGHLTADWREENNFDSIWQSTTLGELIIDKPKNGYSAKPVNYETPFRVITLTATTSGKFNSEHFKYFDENIDKESSFWLQPDDILVQRGNTIEYVGVSAIYDGSPNQFIFPDLMMRLRAKPMVLTRFLHVLLSCEKSRKYLRNRATGTAGNMPKINQPTLVSLPIDLPEVEEQKEIVQRVEKLFKAIDLIEQEYQKASKLCDRLEQATLAKAFRGELVPQDPDDEPAAVLLERIRAERQDQPKGKAVKLQQKPGQQADLSD